MADSIDRVGGIQSSASLQGGGNHSAQSANQSPRKTSQTTKTADGGNGLPQAATGGAQKSGTPKAGNPQGSQNAHGKHPTTAAADALNAYLASTNHQLRFRLDKASGDVVVRVIDLKNNKVIRQFPPEQMLKLAAALRKMGRIDTTGLRSQA